MKKNRTFSSLKPIRSLIPDNIKKIIKNTPTTDISNLKRSWEKILGKELSNKCTLLKVQKNRGGGRGFGTPGHGHRHAHRKPLPVPGHRVRRELLPEGRAGVAPVGPGERVLVPRARERDGRERGAENGPVSGHARVLQAELGWGEGGVVGVGLQAGNR